MILVYSRPVSEVLHEKGESGCWEKNLICTNTDKIDVIELQNTVQ